jgi:hypothetical protein
MGRPTALVAVSVALLPLLACSTGKYGPSLDTAVKPAPREIDELSVAERRALLDRAHVFRPIDTAKLDLLAGPRGRDAFAPDERVSCTFAFPDKPLTGATAKFECAVRPGDVVKVKYGEDNGEVFAEVAASRLFWALGFLADRMYPVRVTCLDCPEDPYVASARDWHLGRPANVAAREFNPASIERQFEGEAIEVPKYKGWSWQELEAVADNGIGAPRAHIDALKLLAAFIQHVDSKPENQSLVCPGGAIGKDRQGNETCARPYLMVKDLGSSFAAASRFRFPKMKLESWRAVDIWRDGATCEANLTSSLVGTLSNPRISEAGRRFLAERLSRLSDRQLRAMFTAARVERRNDQIEGRPVTADDWVHAFKEKREQIVRQRCAA